MYASGPPSQPSAMGNNIFPQSQGGYTAPPPSSTTGGGPTGNMCGTPAAGQQNANASLDAELDALWGQTSQLTSQGGGGGGAGRGGMGY